MNKMIDELKAIGLTQYEANAYSLLIRQNNLSATEISNNSDIPQGKIYSVMDSLVQKGFCLIIPSTVKRFSAISPKIAIKNLIDLKEKKLRQMQATADKLEEEFISNADQKSPLNYIKIYTSKSSLINKIKEMSDKSTTSSICFNKPPYSNSHYENPQRSISKDSVQNMIARNIEMREIWEIDYDKLDKFLTYVKYIQELGVKVKVTEKLPVGFMISDDANLLFMLKNNEIVNNVFTSMYFEHSDLIETFNDLFEYHWDKAMTIDELFEQKDQE